MAIGVDEFKRCLSRWASGVTIVTSRAGDEIHGMTVSDFSGASLSPPLVAVCCNRESITTGLISRAGCFAVNVLADDQRALSDRFASKKHEHERFVGVAHARGLTGAPLLDGCLLNLDCRLTATYDAGDHVIHLGEIQSTRQSDRQPLLYWSSSYRKLAESPA